MKTSGKPSWFAGADDYIGIVAVLVLIAIGFAVAAPSFGTFSNLMTMLHDMGPMTLAACAVGVTILAGKIDISIGSMVFLSASTGALIMESTGLHPVFGFAIILVTATALGAFNGFLIAVLRIDALIATLGTMIAYRGLGLVYTEARVVGLPEVARSWGNTRIGPVFVDVLIIALVILVVHYAYRRTVLGRHINAVGDNEANATQLGIPTGKTIFLVFTLSGFLSGLAATASFNQVGSVSGFLGRGLEFDAIAAAVVGGISLSGGRGTIFPGIVLGALAFQMIFNGLNQIGADPYIYQVVTGALIFAAMYVDALKRGNASWLSRLTRGFRPSSAK
ncbi:ABC transporter permease [Hoeflea prorocentri]|uniref:Autoinducer 2 import system permease protein LsrD n=1 Tax=Hoeflea prorocentri TaxID=1922333 RepID=A0A9X3UM18_9HYPH|nr:ABC transporter permease [Hoeflea prorocentri]MCY6383036.1 ABC transporter permease [Hoeflea prorocentri]MDA5400836.1 ABC transporter permease [Hoeflea prorocentri]